jgi:hypothetical protein
VALGRSIADQRPARPRPTATLPVPARPMPSMAATAPVLPKVRASVYRRAVLIATVRRHPEFLSVATRSRASVFRMVVTARAADSRDQQCSHRCSGFCRPGCWRRATGCGARDRDVGGGRLAAGFGIGARATCGRYGATGRVGKGRTHQPEPEPRFPSPAASGPLPGLQRHHAGSGLIPSHYRHRTSCTGLFQLKY